MVDIVDAEKINLRIKPRIGLILPSVQAITEPLFYKYGGQDFDFLANRVRLKGGEIQDLIEMEERLPAAAEELTDAKVELLVYCCTASGAISGMEKEIQICSRICREMKVPMITTMISCVEALKNVFAQNIVMVSPYIHEINLQEIDFFDHNGFRVLVDAGLNIRDRGNLFSTLTIEEITKFALNNWDDKADALFMSCMNWRAMETLAKIESIINKPVITSHSATLWNIYRSMNRDIDYLTFTEIFLKKQY